MSDSRNKPFTFPKIRTFAGDLKEQKEKREPEINNKKQTPEENITEKEKSAAPKKETRKPIPIPILKKTKAPIDIPEKSKEESESPIIRKSTIPAYHELQKKINKIDKDSQNKNTKTVAPIKVDKPIIKKNNNNKKPRNKLNIGYDATIITDTKKHNPDFFPTIIKSISDWFQKILTPKPKATPKYTVADSSTRKGVIQKATTKTGSIFTADNESLKDQIRKRRLEEADRERDINDEAETSWSPYTETGYDLLESPDIEEESFSSIPTVPQANKLTETEAVPVLTPETEPTEIDLDEERWSSPTPAQSQESNTVPSKTVAEEVGVPEKKEETIFLADNKKTETTPVPSTKHNNQKVVFGESLEEIDTNTMSVMILMIIIGIVSVVLVGRLVYQYIDDSLENDPAPSTKVVSLLENSTISNLSLTTADLDNITTLIDQNRLSNDEAIAEIVLTDGEGNELSAPYILELLDFSMMPTMKQSITSIRFLSIDQKEELILLKFSNEENIRGGFLDWEDTLSSDLNGLYGTRDSNNNFIDQQIVDVDMRKLVTDNGITITYSLVNTNSALISISENDLERIINLEFKP